MLKFEIRVRHNEVTRKKEEREGQRLVVANKTGTGNDEEQLLENVTPLVCFGRYLCTKNFKVLGTRSFRTHFWGSIIFFFQKSNHHSTFIFSTTTRFFEYPSYH